MRPKDQAVLRVIYVFCILGMSIFVMDLFIDMPYSGWLVENIPVWFSIIIMCSLCLTTIFIYVPIKSIMSKAFIGAFYAFALILLEYNITVAPQINKKIMLLWLVLTISLIAVKKLSKESAEQPNKAL
nr:hypothetical protein [uncultured bacterium]